MSYLNRLIADSGISLPTPDALVARAAAGEAPPVDSPEVVETIEISGTPPPSATALTAPLLDAARPEAAPQVEQTAQPAPPTVSLERVVAADPSIGPRMQPVPQPAPEMEEQVVVRPARYEEPRQSSRENQAPSLQGPPPEAPPAQRILRTLAAVREWTAATPESGGVPGAAVPAFEVEQSVVANDSRTGPLIEIIDTPAVRGPQSSPSQPPVEVHQSEVVQRPAATEPEVVNLSVSIGSIEVTVEGTEQAGPNAPSPPPEHSFPGPDATARLRRQYYRPPVGW